MLPKKSVINKQSSFLNSLGVISPLLLLGIVIILVLFVVLGSLPIKDRLLGGLFPQSESQAAGVVDLRLVPDTLTVAAGQTFLVDIEIDAKTEQPTAAQVNIKFDPTILQAQSFQNGFFFNTDTFQGSPSLVINNTSGVAAGLFTVGPEPLGCTLQVINGLMAPEDCVFNYKSGTGRIATLQFKALQATNPSSVIRFDTTNSLTQISALNKTGDQLGTTTNSTVTVTAAPTVNKTAQFTLTAPASAQAGQQFNLVLRASTPDEANLFAARLNFNPALLEVVSIDTNGSFITPAQWVNNNFDNSTGLVSLIGGVPTPGFKSTAGATMATVVFRAKSGGSAEINFGANSAIYRNADNVDILATPTGSTVSITGVAPSASPSAAPSASPSVAPSASPTSQPSTAPSSQPSPSAGASVAPSPSASTSPTACAITGATWGTTTNPVNQGKVVSLSVTGSGTCDGQSVSFSVWEDDAGAGNDPTQNTPPMAKFNSNNTATTSWLAEFQEDGLGGIGNPPEFYFLAQLTGGTSFRSTGALLQVNKLAGGVALTGDFNRDTKVDLVDLSILLSNWNKTSDFSDELDLNTDGSVNSVDWGTMLQILRIGGIIQ